MASTSGAGEGGDGGGCPDGRIGGNAGEGEDYVPSNVLVTGGAGFIASHVVTRLVHGYPHYTVVVLDKLSYCASLRNLDSVKGKANYHFIQGDIQSGDLLGFVFRTYRIDTVLHFAAQTHVDNSFGNSLAFSVTNVCGTHSVLESCRAYGGIRRLVNVSTDEVYGEQSYGREEASGERSTLEPTNPYSAAKAGAEMMVSAYLASYKLPCLTTRGNNVYGPGQFPEKLVPKFILLASEGRPLPVHGSGDSTRSFLYVEDVACAYDVVLHKGRVGEVYNIGTQDEMSVLAVAKDVCEVMQVDPTGAICHVRNRCYNDRRYFISDEKLRALGWQPRVGWQEGLRKTVAWYREHDASSHWKENDVKEALKPHPEIRSDPWALA